MDLNIPPRVTPRAFERLAEINDGAEAPKALRVAVEGGGCSGFQYNIDLDEPSDGDLVLEGEGQKLTKAKLVKIHEAKTAALLTTSIRLGAMSANATDKQLRRFIPS